MKKTTGLAGRLEEWRSRRRLLSLAWQVSRHSHAKEQLKPVVFFNASARLGGLSQNAAFAFLSSCGLGLAGWPVHHFVCRTGMSHCVLGVNRQDYHTPPPCSSCIGQSQRLFRGARVHWFSFQPDTRLSKSLEELDIARLQEFEAVIPLMGRDEGTTLSLGQLVLPSIRWTLRRHTLPDDDQTRYLYREFILSAENIAREFAAFINELQPAVAVIFNGIMYPEAAAGWVARRLGIRVVTHEVGFQRFSAFFSDGEATAYPIPIPAEFKLSEKQDQRLDDYLESRFQGKFSMAGIRFWPEMRGLDREFQEKAARFRQVVPVFTNVVYDTSQVHANRIFSNMFEWLDLVLKLIRNHPDTFFVIRAHPDEMRPGTAKLSRESVRDWITDHHADQLENLRFIDSQEYLSSYELIQLAKFVMVYNSSIGMEAAILGAAVLCAGKARYTQYPMVFFPGSPHSYESAAEDFLSAQKIDVPPEFRQNARRFLYYQLFRASLRYDNYLDEGRRKGYVQLRPFPWQDLTPEKSPTIRLLEKALFGGPAPDSFILPDQLED